MVTIEIKENSKQAKAFIALAKTLSFVKFKEGRSTKKHIVSENIPNPTTLSSMEKTKKRIGLSKPKNLDQFLEEVEKW